MIARFKVLLPYNIYIPAKSRLKPFNFQKEEYKITVYPPQQSLVTFEHTDPTSDQALEEVLKNLKKPTKLKTLNSVKIDGKPSVKTDFLQIDFRKEIFDRRKNKPVNEIDPPIELIFEVINSLLSRVRSVMLGFTIKTIDQSSGSWMLEYLTDDGKEFEHDPLLVRKHFALSASWKITSMNARGWKKAQRLGMEYQMPAWQKLILDAESLLPDKGPSLILAYSALELLISNSLDSLAKQKKISSPLWEWINDRGQWIKNPSVDEQLDKILFMMTGKSLKKEERLWKAYSDLKNIRNNFIHEGRLVLNKKDKKEITKEQAYTLIGETKQIIDWIEKLLPKNLRRPMLKKMPILNLSKMIIAPVK